MISSETARNKYTGNNSTATYAYGFKLFDDDHVLVKVRNTLTEAETTLTKTTDYTVSSVGEASGGNIVLVDANQAWLDGVTGFLDDGYEIIFVRDIPLTQETDFSNQDDFYPETHEQQFDKIVHMIQMLSERVDRCIKVSEIDFTEELILPAKDDRASTTLSFDADGLPTVE